MRNAGNAMRYYLFALSNFMAAFGGGMILGRGISAITTSFIARGGSILAFFVGTILGLFFLQFIPNRLTKSVAHFFSFCGAIMSLILLFIYTQYAVLDGRISDTPALFFFACLSIRFAFWFYSRVFRASEAAGQQQKIAWVELGYYAGMIAGLIIWEFLNIQLAMTEALMIDAALQISAGLLDVFGNRIFNRPVPYSAKVTNVVEFNADKKYLSASRLMLAVVFLTIGSQVVSFSLAHQVNESFGYAILACFYFGVSIAAIIYSPLNIKLNLYLNNNNNVSTSIYCRYKTIEISFTCTLLTFLSLMSVLVAQLLINTHAENNFHHEFILLMVCVSAFFYEILALALIDKIGLWEKTSQQKGFVMRTYGLMGIGAAISFWMMSLMDNFLYAAPFVLSICFISVVFAMTKAVKTATVSEMKL